MLHSTPDPDSRFITLLNRTTPNYQMNSQIVILWRDFAPCGRFHNDVGKVLTHVDVHLDANWMDFCEDGNKMDVHTSLTTLLKLSAFLHRKWCNTK